MRHWMFAIAVLFTGVSAAATPDLSQAIHLDVDKYQLNNGLTVLLQEDHAVPMISYHTWYRVGSKDEDHGRTGLAHFFEHMMYKGTPKYSKETYAEELQSRGADYNAFTTADYTGFYVEGPKDTLPLIISMESDRMRNLALKPDDVNSEREVVKEEKRMSFDNRPEGVITESLDEMMFRNLPYRWPVIGSMEDLNQASMADLRAFYKRYYSPNNAVIVVAGDFDPAQVKRWLQNAYGGISAETIDRKTFAPEWNQAAVQEKTIHRNVQSPIVATGYLTAPAASPDTFATDLILTALATGDSSRLQKKLVYQKQIATGVHAGCQDEILASRCLIYIYLKPGASPKQAIQLVENEMQDLMHNKMSDKELEKAKNNYLMEYLTGLKKTGGRAESLAYNEVLFGDYRKLYTDVPQLEAVTPEQVQAIASKYFRPRHKNIVTVIPNETKPKQTTEVE